MKRLDRISRIKKIASKAGVKAAKGMNHILPSTFSEAAIMEIFGITLDPGFEKMTTAQEKQFLELGWYLAGKSADLSSIKDFMMSKNATAGFLLKNYPWYDEGSKEIFSNLDKIKGVFGALVNHTNEYHEDLKEKSQDLDSEKYKSDEVVYNFGDGWRVVYVPAVGEVEPYPGFPNSSYDRVLEGNKNGLCLGTGDNNPLYQDNSDGKTYSLRDPKNKPKVTFRIQNKVLHEAKGRFNYPPDVASAIYAKTWLENIFSQGDLNSSYKDTMDYQSFPPTTLDSARDAWFNDQENFLKSGWVAHWYNQGLTELDNYIDSKATVLELISGGLVEKNPKKFEEMVKSSIESDPNIFRFFIQNRTPIWSIYKDRGWMKSAVKDRIENDSLECIRHDLYKIKDYQDYFLLPKGDGSILEYVILENNLHINNSKFMVYLSEIPKFKNIINKILEYSALKEPEIFVSTYYNSVDLDDLNLTALEEILKKDPAAIITNYYCKILAERLGKQHFFRSALESISENNPELFLERHVSDAKKLGFKDLIDEALKNLAKEDPFKYMSKYFGLYGEDNLALLYLENMSNNQPEIFINNYQNMPSFSMVERIAKYSLQELVIKSLSILAASDPKKFLDNFGYLAKHLEQDDLIIKAEQELLKKNPNDPSMPGGLGDINLEPEEDIDKESSLQSQLVRLSIALDSLGFKKASSRIKYLISL